MRGAAIGRPRPRARRPREPPIPITEGDLVRAASLVEAEEVETRGLTPNEVCMATREITGHSISQLARMSATTLAALQRMTRAMRYIIELRDVSESIEEDTEIRYSEVVGVVLEVLDCLYEDANLLKFGMPLLIHTTTDTSQSAELCVVPTAWNVGIGEAQLLAARDNAHRLPDETLLVRASTRVLDHHLHVGEIFPCVILAIPKRHVILFLPALVVEDEGRALSVNAGVVGHAESHAVYLEGRLPHPSLIDHLCYDRASRDRFGRK